MVIKLIDLLPVDSDIMSTKDVIDQANTVLDSIESFGMLPPEVTIIYSDIDISIQSKWEPEESPSDNEELLK